MTTVLDQHPIPLTNNGDTEFLLQSTAVAGGTIYTSIVRSGGAEGQPVGVSNAFVPASASGLVRSLPLSSAKADTGAPLAATASGGACGFARTAGTSFVIVGEAAVAGAKTDKCLWEFALPESFVAGAAIPVNVNAHFTGAGTITAASCTLGLTAFSEVNGVETALTITGGNPTLTSTATNLGFTVTGTGLVAGEDIVLETTVLITTTSGTCTGQINGVSFTA